jgi:hypothetical protein
MDDFFTPSKNKDVNLTFLEAKPNANTGDAKQLQDKNIFDSNNFEQQNETSFDEAINYFKEDVTPLQENPNERIRNIADEEINNEDEPETEAIDNEEQRETKGEKQSVDFYQKQGEFIANMTDIAIPNGIAYLKEEKGNDISGNPYANKYKADTVTKKEIASAWARVLEEKETVLTPTQQLIWANVMGYGLPIGLGIWAKIQSMQEAKEIREAEMLQTLAKMQNVKGTEQPPENPLQPEEQQEEIIPRQAVKPEEKKPTKVNHKFFDNKKAPDENIEIDNGKSCETCNKNLSIDDIYQIKTDDLKRECIKCKEKNNLPAVKPNPEAETKICSNENCNKSYEAGTGHAKTKGTKAFDKFCSRNCMYNFISHKAVKTKQDKKRKNAEK